MPVFTIETPTGRKLDIEAADEAGAIKGAQEWETQNPAKAPAPAAKPFGEKLKNFLGNVTAEGPISGLIALTRLAGDTAKGDIDMMSDQGINRAIPTITEGSVAVAPSARGRPLTVAPKAPVVEGPAAAPGTVRFYHGGTDPTSGGPRWLSPDPEYARNFRAGKTPNEVHYVDIPENSPHLPNKSFDDTGTGQKSPYVSFEAPAEIAQGLKPVAPPTAPAAEGGGVMGSVMKYGVPIAAEVLGTMHGMPGAATLARMTAGHLLSKLAPKEPAPLTSRFEGTPSVGDQVAAAKAPQAAPETLRTNPEPIVSPAPAEGNPALAKAREQAQVMNLLAKLAQQGKDKQAQGARDTSALQAAGASPMNPGIARLTPEPNAEMAAGALQGAAGTPMNPGVARLTPEPAPAPPAPTPTALPRDVASQGKLLSSGMLKVAKMREAAAKAEATPIEKIIEKAKAPKEEPKSATLDETFGDAKGGFTPSESDYAHMSLQDAARHIVEAQKAKGIKFWHAEDSYIKATAGRLGAKGVIASKVAKVVGVPEPKLKSWVQGAKTRADATALRDHLKSLANKSNHRVIDDAFKEGLKQGWSK